MSSTFNWDEYVRALRIVERCGHKWEVVFNEEGLPVCVVCSGCGLDRQVTVHPNTSGQS